MANYNSFQNLIIDMGPYIQPTLREVGSIFGYANTDFSAIATANKGDTIDAVFAGKMTATAITPSPSGTNMPALAPVRKQLVLNNWYEAGFIYTSKEEQEVRNGQSFIAQQLNQAIRAVALQVETTLLQSAISGAANINLAGHGLSSSLSPLAKCRKNLADNFAPADGRTFLYGTNFGLDLAGNTTLLKVNEAGTPELLRQGQQSNILGFALQESNFLSNITYSTSGSVGIALQRNGLGVAMRPASTNDNAVLITDPVTGMTMVVSQWQQEYQKKMSVSALWGTQTIFTGSIAVLLDN